MHPKPIDLKLEQDLIRFILIIINLGGLALIYTLVLDMKQGLSFWESLLWCLDMITIIVPPALPAALAIGRLYSQSRLKKTHKIFCTSPPRINCAGQVDLIAFDKTGTLTEDHFTVVQTMPFSPQADELLLSMACCHSISVTDSGNQLGDPLDIELVKRSGYEISDDGKTVKGFKQSGPDGKDVAFEIMQKFRMMSIISSLKL